MDYSIWCFLFAQFSLKCAALANGTDKGPQSKGEHCLTLHNYCLYCGEVQILHNRSNFHHVQTCLFECVCILMLNSARAVLTSTANCFHFCESTLCVYERDDCESITPITQLPSCQSQSESSKSDHRCL